MEALGVFGMRGKVQNKKKKRMKHVSFWADRGLIQILLRYVNKKLAIQASTLSRYSELGGCRQNGERRRLQAASEVRLFQLRKH